MSTATNWTLLRRTTHPTWRDIRPLVTTAPNYALGRHIHRLLRCCTWSCVVCSFEPQLSAMTAAFSTRANCWHKWPNTHWPGPGEILVCCSVGSRRHLGFHFVRGFLAPRPSVFVCHLGPTCLQRKRKLGPVSARWLWSTIRRLSQNPEPRPVGGKATRPVPGGPERFGPETTSVGCPVSRHHFELARCPINRLAQQQKVFSGPTCWPITSVGSGTTSIINHWLPYQPLPLTATWSVREIIFV